MGTPKFSTFIIALVWVSFFAAIFAGFISDVATNYGVDQTNLNITAYNKLERLNTETEELKESAASFETQTGITDIIGAYFTNGYQTGKIALTSLNVFYDMTNTALNEPGLDIPSMHYLKTSVIITVLVFLVIGVLLSAILKKDV